MIESPATHLDAIDLFLPRFATMAASASPITSFGIQGGNIRIDKVALFKMFTITNRSRRTLNPIRTECFWRFSVPADHYLFHCFGLLLTVSYFSVIQGSCVSDQNSETRDGYPNEGPPLVRPLPRNSSNRPLRLGLSRKHNYQPLHPYFKKQ